MTSCVAPSLSRYKDKRIRCRCDGCKRANRIYMRRYRKVRDLLREPSLADAASTRVHIIDLRESGLTYRAIAERANVPLMSVYRIAKGQVQHCQKELSQKLLAS